MDALRREKARQQAEEQHCQELDETVEAPFPADEANALHWALDQLEPRQREVLVLHFLEDFSLVQIAQIVGCPEGTVKSRMHQAKKTMKVILTRGTCEQL